MVYSLVQLHTDVNICCGHLSDLKKLCYVNLAIDNHVRYFCNIPLQCIYILSRFILLITHIIVFTFLNNYNCVDSKKVRTSSTIVRCDERFFYVTAVLIVL